MARTAKKEKALTPEEKLAQALAPDVEQPYRVPDNWCWVVQGQVSAFHNGRAYKQAELLEDETKTPVLRVGNLFTNTSWYYSDLKLDENKYLDSEDLIYAWSASFGPFIWHGGRVIYHYHIWKVELTSVLKKEFYYYWLVNDTERLKKQGHGTGMIHVTKEMMENTAIPLPPLAEQQRIVDRIESLFTKLDEAKEKAQAVVDGFGDRKVAILHKAFTGELTAEWRNTHGVSIADWENAPLETVFQLRSGSTIDVCEELEYGAIPYVKVADMNLPENEIQITTSSRFVDECPESHVIPKGSTIFPKRGGAILTNKKRYVGVEKIIADLNTMAIMPIAGRAYGWYGYYWMQSVDLRQLNNGSNVPQINNKDMVKLFVPTPSIDEQKAIVGILDGVFDKEIEAKETAEQVIDQIDSMKKSILARAFRGELGTNDPNDESAVELLKRVL